LLSALGASAGATAIAGCLGLGAEDDDNPESVTLEEDFEGDDGQEDPLADWETEAHIGPEVDLDAFEWSIESTDERAKSGERSVSIFTEGKYDDGTAWLVRAIDVEPGYAYEAEASVYAWSDSESFNELRKLVSYLGPERPESEMDFPQSGEHSIDDVPGAGLREPLDRAEGWEEYTFTWDTPELEADTLYFAVGVSVVWETDRMYFIDDVEVTLEPQ
ncbi:MAG: hypothetical protein ACOC0X_02430, partial [Halobacteriota archaeon]